MFALLLVGLVASACAAPQYFQHYRPEHRPYGSLSDFVSDDTFDTRRFWEGLEASMYLEHMLEDFYKQFPSSVNTEGIDGNEYKIIISLPNFEEKDIVVKAREGTLMVQATRTGDLGSQHSYLDIRSLPSYIDVAGSWSYSDDVLTIEFPIKNNSNNPPKDSSEEIVTAAPVTEDNRDREEMEPHDKDDTSDADIINSLPNFERKDNEFELKTNLIPTHRTPVEATTYAVDLNNEIEFVPVSLK